MEGVIRMQAAKGNLVKVKRIKVTPKDIQENCLRIKAMMDATPIGTPKYEALQSELLKEQDILKKCLDNNRLISLKDALVIGSTGVAVIFFIALTREYPSALKMASMIMKFVPYKG